MRWPLLVLAAATTLVGVSGAPSAGAQEPDDRRPSPAPMPKEPKGDMASTAIDVPKKPLLVFRGNVVMNSHVYRAFLNLPRSAQATQGLANSVRFRLLALLHRAGYDLASVESNVIDDQIYVDIDEGRLDKVIFLGQGTYEQLRLKLEFNLPGNVFNRLLIEEQLDALKRSMALRSYRWELVPTHEVRLSLDTQIERIRPLPNLELIPEQQPYELHITLDRPKWESGVGLDATVNGVEGVGVGMHYRDGNLLLDGDRWEVGGHVAGDLRSGPNGDDRPYLSAVVLELRWYTPPFITERLRSFVKFGAKYTDRQRLDVGLETFKYAPFELSGNVEYEFGHTFKATVGAGFEHRRIFGLHAATATVSPVVASVPGHQTRVFLSATGTIQFNRDELRKDRAHLIELEARLYEPADAGREAVRRLTLAYQKDFQIGWHELWLRSRGGVLGGDVIFADEQSIGEHIRGAFSSIYFVRKAASLSLEFRLSLVRDLVKVSLFHDLAVFGAQDLARTRESAALANSFGPGVHLLILDAFQLDAYYGVGFSSLGRFDHGIALAIRQAY